MAKDNIEKLDHDLESNLITAGDRRCYVYLDCEFTSLRKDADLISIGLVDCDGRTFYAEFTDYNIQKCETWVFENVIKKLKRPENVLNGEHWTMVGNKNDIATQLLFWLDKIIGEKRIIQIVSDCGHFDFVFFLDLILGEGKSATNTPSWLSPVYLDINQDIATSMQHMAKPDDFNGTDEEWEINYTPIRSAFSISREQYVENTDPDTLTDLKEKHTALYDAQIIRAIHQFMWAIKEEPEEKENE